MKNRKLLGLLWALPILCAAPRCCEAEALPAFDHQLELFTELATEGKVAGGADPALANDSGITPMQIAEDKSFPRIARLLLY